MDQSQEEQRTARRFAVRLPVVVKYGAGPRQKKSAETRDVSSRGICFYVDTSLDEGSEIEFTLTLPPEVTMTETSRVRGRGKVVRVEEAAAGGRVAIAASIERYEFLSEP